MTIPPTCLAIDLGTTRVKVAIVDPSGAVLALTSRALETSYPDGGAEQDADAWWTHIVDSVRELASQNPQVVDALQCVTCTSQYMTLVPVAEDGSPVGPALMWMDNRGAMHSEHLRTRTLREQWSLRHGLAPFGADDLAHLLFFLSNRPDIVARAKFFVEPADALTARLVGYVTTNRNTAFPMLLTDNRSLDEVGFDAELVALSGIDPGLLAPMVPIGSQLGPISAAAAAQMGLRARPMVISATIDSATSAIGTGAIDSGQCGVVIGTTSVAVAHTPKLAVDPRRSLMSAPSGLPGRYVLLAENGAGGRALEQIAGLLGHSPASLIALAERAPGGSGGVSFQPWLVGSMAPRPHPQSRAGFTGLSLSTGASQLARAVVEGISSNMAWLLSEVEVFLGVTIDRLNFGGGAAQSALWAQILADACQRPVGRISEPSATNARGAALLAFAHSGALAFEHLATRVPVAQVHEPDPRLAGRAADQLDMLMRAHDQGALRALRE